MGGNANAAREEAKRHADELFRGVRNEILELKQRIERLERAKSPPRGTVTEVAGMDIVIDPSVPDGMILVKDARSKTILTALLQSPPQGGDSHG